MARTPKPSVRYYLPSKARANENQVVKLRGVASFNRKRISFPAYLESIEISLFVSVINPDGTYTYDSYIVGQKGSEDDKLAKEVSEYLLLLKDFIIQIIEKAVAANKWEYMTSADLETILHFYEVGYSKDKVEDNASDIFAKKGIFDKWLEALGAQVKK